jgi:hypothetical protein
MANNNTEKKSFKEWFEEHKKPILIGGGIFVAVVAGTVVCYKIGKKHSEIDKMLSKVTMGSDPDVTIDCRKLIADDKFKVINLTSDAIENIPEFKEDILDQTLDGVVEAKELIDKYFDDLFEKIDPSKIGAISVAYDIV